MAFSKKTKYYKKGYWSDRMKRSYRQRIKLRISLRVVGRALRLANESEYGDEGIEGESDWEDCENGYDEVEGYYEGG